MKNSIKTNFFWDYLNRFGSTAFGLVTSIILSRILSPNEFGIVGISIAVTSLGGIFLNLGFVNGIIQSKILDNQILSTVFYLNLAIAILIYFGIFISSDWICNYYEINQLGTILKVSSIAFIFNAMSLISYAQLNREMKFKLIAGVDLSCALLSGCIGIYLALNQYGVWSIVYQQLSNSILMFFCFYYFKKWKPLLYFNLSSISSLFKFGKYLFLSNLLETVYSRFDLLVIAKIFNVNTLGLYTRAQGLELSIRNLSSSSLITVLFPAFSNVNENIFLLKKLYYKYFEIICFIFFLLGGIFYLISEQLFIILFGIKWIISSLFFKLMIIAAFSYPLCNIGNTILQARGNSKMVLIFEISKRIIQIPSYFIAYYYGITNFLISYILLSLLNTLINISFVKNEIGISNLKTLKILLLYLVPTLLLVIIVQFKYILIPISSPFVNSIQNISFFIIGYLLLHYFNKSKPFFSILSIIKSNLN